MRVLTEGRDAPMIDVVTGRRATSKLHVGGETAMSGRTWVRAAAALSVLFVAALLGPTPIARAATFVVNSTADVPDFLPGNGVCDSTSGAGTCTLRAAINEANALGGSHTIQVPAGTITLTTTGASEDGGLAGDLDILADITINGDGAATTIIDGNLQDRVFDVRTNGSATIRDLTVRNGCLLYTSDAADE